MVPGKTFTAVRNQSAKENAGSALLLAAAEGLQRGTKYFVNITGTQKSMGLTDINRIF